MKRNLLAELESVNTKPDHKSAFLNKMNMLYQQISKHLLELEDAFVDKIYSFRRILPEEVYHEYIEVLRNKNKDSLSFLSTKVSENLNKILAEVDKYKDPIAIEKKLNEAYNFAINAIQRFHSHVHTQSNTLFSQFSSAAERNYPDAPEVTKEGGVEDNHQDNQTTSLTPLCTPIPIRAAAPAKRDIAFINDALIKLLQVRIAEEHTHFDLSIKADEWFAAHALEKDAIRIEATYHKHTLIIQANETFALENLHLAVSKGLSKEEFDAQLAKILKSARDNRADLINTLERAPHTLDSLNYDEEEDSNSTNAATDENKPLANTLLEELLDEDDAADLALALQLSLGEEVYYTTGSTSAASTIATNQNPNATLHNNTNNRLTLSTIQASDDINHYSFDAALRNHTPINLSLVGINEDQETALVSQNYHAL